MSNVGATSTGIPFLLDLSSLERRRAAHFTNDELREFERQSRKMERELTQAHSAGLFLTAADLRE